MSGGSVLGTGNIVIKSEVVEFPGMGNISNKSGGEGSGRSELRAGVRRKFVAGKDRCERRGVGRVLR
jgi:hypothetical protein